MKLKRNFYLRDDVTQIARELLGKYLMSRFNEGLTGGMIIETEAYEGITDKASHAWNNRKTKRTEVMYRSGGIAYVYLCYGIHHLFNVVTNRSGIPHAVLIRAILPEEGIELMMERRKKKKLDNALSSGPGALTQALGIKTLHTGYHLTGKRIWIEDRHVAVDPVQIETGPRIGVAYAGDDALRPYRFKMHV